MPSNEEVKLLGPKGAKYVAVMHQTQAKYKRGVAKPFKDNIVIPYWLVRRVQDKSKANMQRTTTQCTVTYADSVQKVSLPIFHNIKDVKQGEELIVYIEPCCPEKKNMPAQTLEPVRKRPAAALSKPPVSKMQKKPRQKK